MSARLEILKASLLKKESAFDARLCEHFDSVRSANGQPLNDKRGGRSEVARWDRQNNALRNHAEGIEKTKRAIEREECVIAQVALACAELPEPISRRLAEGSLQQWRKHPRTFFVTGVDKARIVVLPNNQVAHRYANQITDREQYRLFSRTFNELSKECNLS